MQNFAALVFFTLAGWGGMNGASVAFAQEPTKAIVSSSILAEWLKEFPTATKEQRKVWPREKKDAYDDWLEAETARKLVENKRIEQENEKKLTENKRIQEANEKKLAENKKLKEELGQIQALREGLKNSVPVKDSR